MDIDINGKYQDIFAAAVYQSRLQKVSCQLKKVIGCILLFLSIVSWGVIALLPFIDISKGEIAGAITFLIITGELLFWGSIVLVGKEVWVSLKGIFD